MNAILMFKSSSRSPRANTDTVFKMTIEAVYQHYPEKYEMMLVILKEYEKGQLSTAALQAHVAGLFKEHENDAPSPLQSLRRCFHIFLSAITNTPQNLSLKVDDACKSEMFKKRVEVSGLNCSNE